MSDANQQRPGQNEPQGWERQALMRLAEAGLREQQISRRWGIFFKLLGFIYLFLLLAIFVGNYGKAPSLVEGRHTALVDLNGVIGAGNDADAQNIVSALENAFEAKGTAGVILRINSPGGSPVQSAYIYDAIRRLEQAHPKIPVYAVIEDVGASGAYYVAAAANRIYANPASLVGSIGVRMDSFGFVDAIKKLGVTRRLLTSGDHKGMLDPFLPQNPEDVTHVQQMLDQIHQQFIQAVEQGRGKRLKKDTPQLFSGWVWTGKDALKLGLIDGFGSPTYVARDVIGAKRIVNYTPRKPWLERLTGEVGTSAARAFMTQLEARQLKLD
ncbi:MAG: S49 family peptidase [Gammaproteobacteria bacterium]|jgi:protease-4